MTFTIVQQATAANSYSASSQIASLTVRGSGQGSPAVLPAASTTGHWLIATITWAQGGWPTWSIPTVSVCDDGNNLWQQLVMSSSQGTARTAIWIAANARPCQKIFISPSGPLGAWAATVTELSGSFNNYVTINGTPASGYTTSPASSLSIGTITPTQDCLIIAVAGNNSGSGQTITGPAGFTAGQAASVASAGSVTATTAPFIGEASSGQSLTFSNSPATTADWAACAVALQMAGAAPPQPNPDFPGIQVQCGFGATPGTPIAAVTWTDVTHRALSLDTQRGGQYELGTISAGSSRLTLDNRDGAFSALNVNSPYYPNVQKLTPVRVLATWQGRTYAVLTGYVERWTQKWADPYFGTIEVTIIDGYGTLIDYLATAVREEVLLDRPYAYWPCADSQGSSQAANIAPGSSAPPLQLVKSPQGTGSIQQQFGAQTALGFGVLLPELGVVPGITGDSGTGWQQSGVANTDLTTGYALHVSDAGFPPISGGVTIEGWFYIDSLDSLNHTQILLSVQNNLPDFPVSGTSGLVCQLIQPKGDSDLAFTVWDKTTGASTTTSVAAFFLWQYIAVVLTPTTWRIDAFGNTIGSGTCNLVDSFTEIYVGGQFDPYFNGFAHNTTVAHVAVQTSALTADRTADHWNSGSGFFGEDSGHRIGRLLVDAGWPGPTGIEPGLTSMAAGSDWDGSALQDVIQAAAATEQGVIFFDGGGNLRYLRRESTYATAPLWVFGTNVSGGEIPYDGTINVDDDDTYIYNDIALTPSTGVAVTSRNQASVAAFLQRQWQGTVNPEYVQDAQDMADWDAAVYGSSQPRVSQITVDGAAYPAAFPTLLGVEITDPIQVNVRPVGAPIVPVLGEINQISHSIAWSDSACHWSTTLQIAARAATVLTVDTAYDLLGSYSIGA